MRAVLFDEYGASDVLRTAELPDPRPGKGEALVRVAATSVNAIDIKIRSGAMKEKMPVELPFVPGVDVAGTVVTMGPNATKFSVGDRVMGLARRTYAELCVVAEQALAPVPSGLSLPEAAALPCVTLTGDQLIRRASKARSGQAILITGALGSVGRSAVFAAADTGCRIIAGVRARDVEKARRLSGVDEAIALDDETTAVSVDCVADTIGGDTARRTLKWIREGGVFGTVVSGDYGPAGVEVNFIFVQPDAAATRHYAKAVAERRLVVPLGPVFPLVRAAEAQDAIRAGGAGKIVLTVPTAN